MIGNIKEWLENIVDIIRRFDIYLIKLLGVKNRECRGVPKLEILMVENFRELMKFTNL